MNNIILLLTILLSVSYKEKSITDYPQDIQDRFNQCIEYHPSDWVCDSCWNAIVIKAL